jgi:hypothetical protein
MPLYTVLRHFPGATDTDLAAAGFRSLACLRHHPGLDWIRSYWNRATETTTCIYRAANEQEIRSHAVLADIPCDEIALVEELLPTDLTVGSEPVTAT